MGPVNKNKRQPDMMSETKSIILTILAPTSLFMIAQAGKADPSLSSSIFSTIQTSDSCAILLFSIWSMIFTIGGWYAFVDKETFGLKEFATKNAFAVYILFIASIILSIIFLDFALTNPCL